MSAAVYVIEKNERDLLILHQKKCWYVGERVVDISASYTADAALRKFRKKYPGLAPCRQCCAGLASSFSTVAASQIPIVFNLEDWLQKRKQCD